MTWSGGFFRRRATLKLAQSGNQLFQRKNGLMTEIVAGPRATSFRRLPPMRRLLPALLLLLPLLAWAHTYHASITELRYNPSKKQVEISLKVFTDDLEKALSQGQPGTMHLDEQPRASALAAAYLQRTMRLGTRPGEALPLQFLGMQHEQDAYWLYARVALPASARPLSSLHLRQGLLLDLFADQMNIVNFEAGGQKQSLLFRAGSEEQEVKF